jgi:hypothetical protein
MRLADRSTGIEHQEHVPDTAEVIIDGKASKLRGLKEGMEVVLVSHDKTVIKVEASTKGR